MKYEVVRTDIADSLIRKVVLYVSENFGNSVALEKLDELENSIMMLGDNPYIGEKPKYPVLRRQGCESFYVVIYKANNPDLAAVFGDDLKSYFTHYINGGKGEGRGADSSAYTLVYNTAYYLHYIQAGAGEGRTATYAVY